MRLVEILTYIAIGIGVALVRGGADVNGDGVVNVFDLVCVANQF